MNREKKITLEVIELRKTNTNAKLPQKTPILPQTTPISIPPLSNNAKIPILKVCTPTSYTYMTYFQK
jgi:hypothetical protein